MSKFLTILALFTLCAISTASEYTIDLNTSKVVDGYGRYVINHGINAVYKGPPFYPSNVTFDANYSLTDIDFQNLRAWGFNSVRLFVSWEATSISRGVMNMTYLNEVLKITRVAAKYNISIILDAHEDAVGLRFCGEGFPDWAIENISAEGFPAPLASTVEYPEGSVFPTMESCLKTPFYIFNAAYAGQEAWENLYLNVGGIRDDFALFWKTVAQVFKNEDNILGYELLNEPYPANFWKNESFFDPKINDIDHLGPMHDALADSIHEADNETIIFFAATVTDGEIGFTHPPGGSDYNNRSVYSFHMYCNNVTALGEPKNFSNCNEQDTGSFHNHFDWAVSMGLVSSLTEFGAISNSDLSAKEIGFICNITEANFVSWYYWQFKYFQDITTASDPATNEALYNLDGTLQATKLKALSRSYAHRICGKPNSTQFEAESALFYLAYAPGSCGDKNTEVYLSEDFYYPQGFNVQFTGCDGCRLVSVDGRERYYYEIQVIGDHDETIAITVAPKDTKKTSV